MRSKKFWKQKVLAAVLAAATVFGTVPLNAFLDAGNTYTIVTAQGTSESREAQSDNQQELDEPDVNDPAAGYGQEAVSGQEHVSDKEDCVSGQEGITENPTEALDNGEAEASFAPDGMGAGQEEDTECDTELSHANAEGSLEVSVTQQGTDAQTEAPDSGDSVEASEAETEAATEQEEDANKQGIPILASSDGNIDLTVTLPDGSAFPPGTQVAFFCVEGGMRGEEMSSSVCLDLLQDAWCDKLISKYESLYPEAKLQLSEELARAVIWDNTCLFLPCYIAITDASGEMLDDMKLHLTFTVHDESAYDRAVGGQISAEVAHHDDEADYTVMPDTGHMRVDVLPEEKAILYSVDASGSGWYTLLQMAEEWKQIFASGADTGTIRTASYGRQKARATGLAAMPDSLEIQDGSPAWAPEALRSGRASTHKRKVVFQTADGEIVKWAYCLEPAKGNPGEDVYDMNQAVILDSGTVNLNLAKTLYYLYGGPAWGRTANGINLKEIMTAAGCESSDNYYAITHYVLSYFYSNANEALWNAHPLETGVLNSKGVSLVKTLANRIASLPSPYADLSKTKIAASYDATRNVQRTESVTYRTFQGNKASISLPSGVTLVNETTGQSGTGKVVIDGGDTFHLETAVSGGKTSYTMTCSVAVDFIAFKKAFSGDAQDIGFAYHAGKKTMTFSVDWPESGFLTLRKISAAPELTASNPLYSLENAKFGVYTDANCTVSVGTLTTDTSGNTPELMVTAGTYYVREESAPKGYLLSREVKTVTVGAGEQASVSFPDVPITQRIRKALQKRVNGNTNLSMQGAQFTVRFYRAGTPSGSPARTWVLRTDEFGVLTFSDASKVSGDAFYKDASGAICLPLGCITFTETVAPPGFQVNPAVITNYVTEEGVKGENGVILQSPAELTEELSFIGVKIRKTDAENADGAQGDASLAGAVFSIISNNDYTVVTKSDRNTARKKGQEVARITTDASGNAAIGAELQAGSYLIKEVAAPPGYELNDAKVLAFGTMTNGEIIDVTGDIIEETVIRGSFSVAKWDLERNEEGLTQGDASLAGAQFSLLNRSANSVLVDVDGDGIQESYEPYEEILRVKTDQKGKYTSPERLLPYGTYELTETAPPVGYTSEGERISRVFSVREDGEHLSFTDETTAVKNRVIRGDISLFKFLDTLSSDESGDEVQPLPDVTFEVRLKSTNELACVLVTDADGFATTVDMDAYPNGRLPYGLYVITETEHPRGVEPVKPFEVFVGLDANGNEIDHFHYKGIYKNDRPVETAITLVKKDGESGEVIAMAGTSFQILDKNKEPLTFVNHYPHREELTQFTTDASGTVNIPEKLPHGTYYVREINAPTGYLRGEDIVFHVEESSTWEEPLLIEYSDVAAKGIIRVRKFDQETREAVAGASFAVFAREDIRTGDGVLHYAKGSLVDAIELDETGYGESRALYLGEYYVQEVTAPRGFCMDTVSYEADATYVDQETPIVYVDREFYNKPTTLELKKTDPDGKALEGILFEITRIDEREPVPDDGGSAAQKTEREIFETDEEGRIVLSYLDPGIYAVKEVQTLPGYMLDTTLHYATVDENGRIFQSDETGKAIDENRLPSDTETFYFVNVPEETETPKPEEPETPKPEKPESPGIVPPKTGLSENPAFYLAFALSVFCFGAGVVSFVKGKKQKRRGRRTGNTCEG